MPSLLKCPRGCERTKGGKNIIHLNTIRGWKTHMTNVHGTWEPHELEEAIAQAGGDPQKPATSSLFDDYATTLPESEAAAIAGETTTAASLEAGAGGSPASGAPGTTTVRTDAAARKLNAKMSKAKRQIAELFPKAVESFIRQKGPGWELDKEKREMLTDSIESVFDILDVQFQIQQFNVELKSRVWVLLYPVAVLAAILGMLAVKNAATEGKKDETTEKLPN